METIGSTGLGSKALTIDDILAAVEKVKALPKPSTEWTVISPDGKMYRGEVQDVMRPLLAAHPLMKPLTLSEMLVPNATEFSGRG